MLLYLVVIAFILLYIYFKIKFSFFKRYGLATPRPWPFFGTLIEENFSGSAVEIENRFLKKYGPVFGTFNGTQPVFNTSVPEHIKQVLLDTDTFHSKGPFTMYDDYLSRSIFFHNDARWKAHRSAMTHHFTGSKLRSLIDHFAGVTNNFLKNVDDLNRESGNKPINVKPLMRCLGIDFISKIVFSIDCNSFKDDSEWVRLAKQSGDINPIQAFLQFFLPTWISDLFKINGIKVEPSNYLAALFKRMLKERRSNGVKYNDLSELLEESIDKGLDMSEEEKIGNCILAFMAGVETVANSLCKLLYYLVENVEIQDRLYAELKSEFSEGISYESLMQHRYLDAVLNESLRLGMFMLIQERTAMKDTRIGEFDIQKGQAIYLIPYLSHTSPDNYPDPLKFNPERFMDKSSSNPNRIDAGTFLPFSHGRKNCLGKVLATLEMKFVLVQLLLNFELKKPIDFNMEEEGVRGETTVKSLPILFQRR